MTEISPSVLLAGALLVYVTLERLFELVWSRRHMRALLAAGAYEVGRGHYPFMVGVHVLWLAVMWAVLLGGHAQFQSLPAILYALVQVLRVWTMATLGGLWTTRIIVVPHVPLVKSGPYRFLRHPNYVVVVLEVALLPLALGAWPLAIGFSAANALALFLRIKAEEATLKKRS